MTLAAAFSSGLFVGCLVTCWVAFAAGAAIGAAVTWDRPRDVPDYFPEAWMVTT